MATGWCRLRRDSQHITDWYTSSHIIPRFPALISTCSRLPRLAGPPPAADVAILIEGSWEVVENSNWIILTLPSKPATVFAVIILATLCHSCPIHALSMVSGFRWREGLFPARGADHTSCRRFPSRLLVELYIRDNLTRTSSFWFHPFEAIRQWQKKRKKGRGTECSNGCCSSTIPTYLGPQ